jgi:membrane-associated phospholipid phosphatase
MKAIFYDWGGLNVWLFQLINGVHSAWLDQLMLLASRLAEHANFAGYAAALGVMALISIRYTGRKAVLPWFAVVCVFVLGYTVDGWVVSWLKDAFGFPRPPLALPLQLVHLVGNPELNLKHSFPSGHASFATLVVASLWPLLNRPGRFLGLFFVGLVAVSRVSLGAHFPADVVGGVLSCLIVVLCVRRLVSYLLDR